MSQIALQFKTRLENVNIMNNNIAFGRLALNSMLMATGVLAILYMLILGNTVFNIVERRALEKEALALSNEVGELELSYLSISNSIDMQMSSLMGFKETKATFATRKPLGRSSTGEALGSVKIANNEI